MLRSKRNSLFGGGRIVCIPVDAIAPNPDRPRRSGDEEGIRALAASILRYGVLQPLTVRRRQGGYELISGARRLQAARLAELREVPCVVLDVDRAQSSVLALAENLQTRGLDFIEEAQALRRLIDAYGFSREEVARRVGRSRSAVANKLRLLQLPPQALQAIREAGLTERHARALLRLRSEEQVARVLETIIRDRLNVRQTDEYVDRLLAPPEPEPPRPMVIVKHVGLFLNTLERSVALLRSGGVDAAWEMRETERELLVTVRIPRGRSELPDQGLHVLGPGGPAGGKTDH